MQTSVPVADEECSTVPLFNVWTVWWNADRCWTGYRHYWDAPIFAPTKSTFAFSESQPVTAVVAPIARDPEFAVLGYNLYLLLSLSLNGWLGYLFVLKLVDHRWVALLAGQAFCLLPFVHWQLGVLQLVAIGPILLYLRSLCCFVETLNWGHAVATGVALGWTYLSCNYYGLFVIGLTATFFFPLAANAIFDVRLWARAAAIIVVFVFIVAPVLLRQFEILHGDDAFRRPLISVFNLSAAPADYLAVACTNSEGELEAESSGFPLSPGRTVVVLSLVGVLAIWRSGSHRRRVFALTLFGSAAFALSLGPRWHVFGHLPFQYLVDFVPGFSSIRSPYRFAVFVQIAAVSMAAVGLDLLAHRASSSSAKGRGAYYLVVAVLALVYGWEVWPRDCNVRSVPISPGGGWVEWLELHSGENQVVLHLPLPAGRSVENFEPTVRNMYWGMWHRRPMATGYSGFFPPPFRLLCRDAEADSPALAEFLIERQITWLIVDESSSWGDSLRGKSGFKEVFRDQSAGRTIFRVTKD